MADQLNMNGLSLNESRHAPNGSINGGRSAYIPPHLRGRGGPPPSMKSVDGPAPVAGNPGLAGSAWGNNAAPPPQNGGDWASAPDFRPGPNGAAPPALEVR